MYCDHRVEQGSRGKKAKPRAGDRVKGALQLQLTALVKFALLRYLSEFRLRVSSF